MKEKSKNRKVKMNDLTIFGTVKIYGSIEQIANGEIKEKKKISYIKKTYKTRNHSLITITESLILCTLKR
jgi:hypothetical protein